MTTTQTPTQKGPRTIYQIHSDLQAIEAMIAESGGEMTEEAEAAIRTWFAESKEQMADKAESYAQMIRVFELNASVAKAEAERIELLAKSRSKAASNLKSRLKDVMQANGLTKLESKCFKFSIVRNGGATPIEVANPLALSGEFQQSQIVANMDAIRTAIDAGRTVDGVIVKDRGTHLRIT